MQKSARPVIAVAGALLLLGVGEHEAWAGGATWAVDLVGESCQSERAAFEREITLACDAVGSTCRVAPSVKDAELRAVLDCSNESGWSLETRTSTGTLIDRVDLGGPNDDRLREAAVEIARDAAPERALAVEALRSSLPNEAPAAQVPHRDRFALALGARATGSSAGGPAAGGAHVVLAYALGRVTHATLGVAGEAGGSEQHASRAVRGGVGLAFGAPFDTMSVFGLGLELGVGAMERYEAVGVAADGNPQLGIVSKVAAHAQTSLMVQWPRDGIRPYASLVGALTTDGDARFFGSGEAGVVFPLF